MFAASREGDVIGNVSSWAFYLQSIACDHLQRMAAFSSSLGSECEDITRPSARHTMNAASAADRSKRLHTKPLENRTPASAASSHILSEALKIAANAKHANSIEEEWEQTMHYVSQNLPDNTKNETMRCTRIAQTLAEDSVMDPHDKLKAIREQLHSTMQTLPIQWPCACIQLGLLVAVSRITNGVWSVEVATEEYDLAVCLLMSNQPELALEHIEQARTILHSVVGDTQVLKYKLDLAESVALLRLKEPQSDAAVRRVRRAMKGFVSCNPKLADDKATVSPQLLPFHFVHLCALLAQGHDHQEALDQRELCLCCCKNRHSEGCDWSDVVHVQVAFVVAHMEILANVCAELNTQAVTGAHEKVLEELRLVTTEEQASSLRQKLENDLSQLDEKREKLRLTLVRQVEMVIECSTAAIRSTLGARGTMTRQRLWLAGLISFCTARACWAGERLSEAQKFFDLAHETFKSVLGEDSNMTLQAQYDLSLVLLRGDMNKAFARVKDPMQPSLATDNSEVSPSMLANARRLADTLNCNEEDDDEDATSKGIERVECLLPSLRQRFGDASSQVHAATLALEGAHRRSGQSGKHATALALLCDIYATTLGPTHPKTLSKVRDFANVRNRVHAPLFSPSWGVHPLLTRVDISCATSGAVVYFTTNGGHPSADIGINQSTRYVAPIVLDRIGHFVIRAFSEKDGKRSGIVEARFSVVKS